LDDEKIQWSLGRALSALAAKRGRPFSDLDSGMNRGRKIERRRQVQKGGPGGAHPLFKAGDEAGSSRSLRRRRCRRRAGGGLRRTVPLGT